MIRYQRGRFCCEKCQVAVVASVALETPPPQGADLLEGLFECDCGDIAVISFAEFQQGEAREQTPVEVGSETEGDTGEFQAQGNCPDCNVYHYHFVAGKGIVPPQEVVIGCIGCGRDFELQVGQSNWAPVQTEVEPAVDERLLGWQSLIEQVTPSDRHCGCGAKLDVKDILGSNEADLMVVWGCPNEEFCTERTVTSRDLPFLDVAAEIPAPQKPAVQDDGSKADLPSGFENWESMVTGTEM